MRRSFISVIRLSGFIAIFFVTFFLVSCTPKYFKPSHFEKMKWIEGGWSSTEQGITITEKWKFISGTGFEGVSYITVSRDTLFSEQNSIRTGPKRSIIFESKSGQINVEYSEPLKLKTLKKNSFTFQSAEKNKTLIYRNKKNNEILIEIRETDGNQLNVTKYELKKTE